MPWEKGKSGNPKGRPPIWRSLASRMRMQDTEECLATLRKLRDSGPPQVQYQVCKYLMERGWGKVPEVVEQRTTVRIEDLDLDILSDEEAAKLRELIGKAMGPEEDPPAEGSWEDA